MYQTLLGILFIRIFNWDLVHCKLSLWQRGKLTCSSIYKKMSSTGVLHFHLTHSFCYKLLLLYFLHHEMLFYQYKSCMLSIFQVMKPLSIDRLAVVQLQNSFRSFQTHVLHDLQSIETIEDFSCHIDMFTNRIFCQTSRCSYMLCEHLHSHTPRKRHSLGVQYPLRHVTHPPSRHPRID